MDDLSPRQFHAPLRPWAVTLGHRGECAWFADECRHHGEQIVPMLRFFPAERLGGLLDLLANGTISSQTAKSLLRIMTEVRRGHERMLRMSLASDDN